MRQSIGTTWILGLVVVFILIFASYLALTISYQRTFKLKNEVLSIIERQEGLTDRVGYWNSNTETYKVGALQLINNYLSASGYHSKGKCPNGWKGATTLDSDATGTSLEDSRGGRYYYCIKKYSSGNVAYPNMSFYKVKLFYKFDLPVIGDIITFDVDGETNDIAVPADSELWGV